MTIRGEDIGRPPGLYMWLVCQDCEKGRYLQSRKPPYPERCASCNRELIYKPLDILSLRVYNKAIK